MSKRFTIGICTYARPRYLEVLLIELLGQIERANMDEVQLLVVDNDPEASAKDLVNSLQKNRTNFLHYHHEPVANISRARNRVLQYSQSEFIAFIDDDQLPGSDFIQQLTSIQTSNNFVAGVFQVLPTFECQPPKWFRFSLLMPMERSAYRQSYVPPYRCSTNGCLLRKSKLSNLMFDESFGVTGGEDTLFFGQLVAQGGRVTFLPQLTVYERVPESRMNRRFLISKAFRTGNALFHIKKKLIPAKVLRNQVLKTTAKLPVQAVTLLGFCLLRKDSTETQCQISDGVGFTLSALLEFCGYRAQWISAYLPLDKPKEPAYESATGV